MLLENMLLRPGDWKWLLAGEDDGEEVATAGATSVSWGAPLASWREFVARRSLLLRSLLHLSAPSSIATNSNFQENQFGQAASNIPHKHEAQI